MKLSSDTSSFYAGLAHMVERFTCNEEAISSILVSGTSKKKWFIDRNGKCTRL